MFWLEPKHLLTTEAENAQMTHPAWLHGMHFLCDRAASIAFTYSH